MGKTFDQLSDKHIDFITKQKLFFVGTAARDGKVNISPKGYDTFRILSPERVVWLNMTGSGNETAAHVQLMPRMTVMFCSFEGSPLILRLYGTAEVIHRGDSNWNDFITIFQNFTGARQLFLLDIETVQTSCGMGVPLFEYAGDRKDLVELANKVGTDGIEKYWKEKNQKSLDGHETRILDLSGIRHH